MSHANFESPGSTPGLSVFYDARQVGRNGPSMRVDPFYTPSVLT
jgi:hypothetical protein